LTSRRVLNSILYNFLGTYTSRYSDLGGYWLFGFLIENITHISIDLLDQSIVDAGTNPLTFARKLAVTKFSEQVAKSGLPNSVIREAHLEISKYPELKQAEVNYNFF
jgi:hypothetical protein